MPSKWYRKGVPCVRAERAFPGREVGVTPRSAWGTPYSAVTLLCLAAPAPWPAGILKVLLKPVLTCRSGLDLAGQAQSYARRGAPRKARRTPLWLHGAWRSMHVPKVLQSCHTQGPQAWQAQPGAATDGLWACLLGAIISTNCAASQASKQHCKGRCTKPKCLWTAGCPGATGAGQALRSTRAEGGHKRLEARAAAGLTGLSTLGWLPQSTALAWAHGAKRARARRMAAWRPACALPACLAPCPGRRVFGHTHSLWLPLTAPAAGA
jgi:hypothetical protein